MPAHPGSLCPESAPRLRDIAVAWWPLAASWLLMGFELPVISAVMARLPDPKISLAAYGGIVFPISILIEAPIIMLLSASTALSRDLPAYRLQHRFMMLAGALLTTLHVAVAFTPLFDHVTALLGTPVEIVESARIGLRIMTPWTFSIAYRRFQQGVLIRFGRSSLVGAGTIVRLGTVSGVVAAGFAWTDLPGIVVGCSGIATGVVAEAVFAGLCVRPVIRREIPAVAADVPLGLGEFLRFYVPLALTPLISLIVPPLLSAAMGRLPMALESLAAWPVLNGLVWTMRSFGTAMNEVTVARIERPGAARTLSRFALILAAATTALAVLLAATPLSNAWFEGASALTPDLSALAHAGLWLALPMPAIGVYQNWHQGILVSLRRTRAITESVVVSLVVTVAVLVAGVSWGGTNGLMVAMAATVLGGLAQNARLTVAVAAVRHATDAGRSGGAG